MEIDNAKINESRAANVALKCDNCSSCLKTDLDNEGFTKLTKSLLLDTKVQIWEALAFVYGVSWASIENYKFKKRTFLKTPDDLRFCENCAALLSGNYNSHLKFEHSSDSSSVVQLLKEFRDYKINSAEKQTESQSFSDDLIESEIKVDVYEDFLSEDLEDLEDPFQSEDPAAESRRESPSLSTENFSDGNTSSMSSEKIQSPSLRILSLRPRRQLIVKTKKLSPEEILQLTKKTGATATRNKRTRLARPKNICTIKNLDNDRKVENETKVKEDSPTPPEAKILKDAQNLQKRKKKVFKKTGRPVGRSRSQQQKYGTANVSFDEKVKLIMEKYKDKSKSKCYKISLNGQFICTVCGEGFKCFEYLRYKHWPSHQVNSTETDKICICDICGKSLNKLYLKEHKVRAHATEEEQNKHKKKCNLCDAIVYSFDMPDHKLVKHSKNPQMKCTKCDKIFVNNRRLNLHVLEVHYNTINKCDVCDKVFSSPKYLKAHERHVHSNRERKFNCDLCSHKTCTKASLEKHRRKHSDLRQYVCENCGKTFKYVSNLREHMICHKEIAEKGEWAFKCDLCQGKTFKHSLSLQKHMKIIHGHGILKIYECSVCSKQLSSATVLRVHENMHKENPGFVPRVRNKLPDYMKCQVSRDKNPNPTVT